MDYIRVGRVVSHNMANGSIAVQFDDDDSVIDEIFLLKASYNPPDIDSFVVCVFPDDDSGICLSSVYYHHDKPQGLDQYSFYMPLGNNSYLAVEKTSGKLVIVANDITISGNVVLTGNIDITGTLKVGGRTI